MKKKIMISITSFVLFFLICGTGLVRGEESLTTKGYFYAWSLSGGLGTKNGEPFKPDNPDNKFMVVVMSLPESLLVPTEAIYGRLKQEQNSDKELAPRTHIMSYFPGRFSLIVSDGRSFKGDLITIWSSPWSSDNKKLGFTSGMQTSRKSPVSRKVTIEVAVAFEATFDSKPPFQIQFDRKKPVPVVDNKIETSSFLLKHFDPFNNTPEKPLVNP